MNKSQNSSLPTQSQIAELAGVSRVAVSQILNGTTNKPYSAETKKRVRRIARELHYRPNRAAQIIRNGRSKCIGILSFGATHSLAQRKVKVATEAIFERGYRWIIEDIFWYRSVGKESVTTAVENLIDSRVEGVLLVYPSVAEMQEMVDRFLEAGIPVVAIAGEHLQGIPSYISDRTWGYEQITRYVLSCGHKRLILLGQERSCAEVGFFKALQDASEARAVSEYFVVLPDTQQAPSLSSDDTRYMPGVWGMQQILDRKGLPDALLCANDDWAMGALTFCAQAGIRVPKEMAVTGFDNAIYGKYGAVPLTTMDHPSEKISQGAVKHLFDLIEGNRPLKQEIVSIRGQLIVRHSCRANEEVPPLSQNHSKSTTAFLQQAS